MQFAAASDPKVPAEHSAQLEVAGGACNRLGNVCQARSVVEGLAADAATTDSERGLHLVKGSEQSRLSLSHYFWAIPIPNETKFANGSPASAAQGAFLCFRFLLQAIVHECASAAT